MSKMNELARKVEGKIFCGKLSFLIIGETLSAEFSGDSSISSFIYRGITFQHRDRLRGYDIITFDPDLEEALTAYEGIISSELIAVAKLGEE